MESVKHWYALYTKPRWEKKVAELLTRKKLESFCPLNKVARKWADRKKIIYEPLFSNYVFVRLTDKEIVSAKQTEGVLNFVYWLGKPAELREEEMQAIKDFLAEHETIQVEKIDVNLRDRVRILSGPLKLLEGEIQEINKKTVKVFLPSLGYMLCAELAKSNIELIKPNFFIRQTKAS